jgi:hypothetical protein
MDRTKLKKMINELEADRNEGYGSKPLLSKTDEIFLQLLHYVKTDASKGMLSWIVSQLNASHFFVFLAFAERMATWAVRKRQTDFIQDALIAMTMVANLGDMREATAVLSLLYDAALRLNTKPKKLFALIYKYCNDEMTEFFMNFINRSEEDKNIEGMGYIFKTENGGMYTRTW